MTTTVPSRLDHQQGPRRILGAGFEIVLHEGDRRAARVVPGSQRVCVTVADAVLGAAGTPLAHDLAGTPGGSSCLCWGRADGSIQVRASWAPPALLVSRQRILMVPETPGAPGLSVMAPGDRLLMLSSSAYEAAPERMVRLLHEEPAHLLAADAHGLLRVLFRDVPQAGGAVVTRLA